jgi:hypothetical protein
MFLFFLAMGLLLPTRSLAGALFGPHPPTDSDSVTPPPEDLDGDGFSVADGDCWDSPGNPDAVLVHPGAAELCTDLLDNDCNGLVNDGCSNMRSFATVRGGGCSSLVRATLPGIGLLLATTALCASRRRVARA